jgi:hypothetical protein
VAGVALDVRGYVTANDRLETSGPELKDYDVSAIRDERTRMLENTNHAQGPDVWHDSGTEHGGGDV